jgi:hypothetical protein
MSHLLSSEVPIVADYTPFFHFDLTSAVLAAEAGKEKHDSVCLWRLRLHRRNLFRVAER